MIGDEWIEVEPEWRSGNGTKSRVDKRREKVRTKTANKMEESVDDDRRVEA